MTRWNVSHLIGVALLAVLFSAPAIKAQGGGQTPAPSPGSGGSTGGSRPTPTPTPSPGTAGSRDTTGMGTTAGLDNSMRRPVFLSGKVVLEDGTPPPDSVVIERVCNGVARPEGYTDSKGHFGFQLGQNTAMMSDATVSTDASGVYRTPRGSSTLGGYSRGDVSQPDLSGCELRASLTGYRSGVVILSGRRIFDNPDVGTLVLRRLGSNAGSTISATSLQAPKDARKAYEKGHEAVGKQKWEAAQKELEKAVGSYPQYAAAWFDLGLCLENQNKPAEARDAYKKAVAADAKFLKPYLCLAQLAVRENKWQDAAQYADSVIKMNPSDVPLAYFYSSLAQYNLQNFDASEKAAREGLKLDPQHRIPKINHILGMALAQKGDFVSSAAEMKSYLQFAPNAKDLDLVKRQLADIERMAAVNAQPQPQK
jgi:tetratricopeptide (TPR) repeat protein